MITDLLDGTLPNLQDILLIQSSILEARDIYQPWRLGKQLLETKDLDVSAGLVASVARLACCECGVACCERGGLLSAAAWAALSSSSRRLETCHAARDCIALRLPLPVSSGCGLRAHVLAACICMCMGAWARPLMLDAPRHPCSPAAALSRTPRLHPRQTPAPPRRSPWASAWCTCWATLRRCSRRSSQARSALATCARASRRASGAAASARSRGCHVSCLRLGVAWRVLHAAEADADAAVPVSCVPACLPACAAPAPARAAWTLQRCSRT